MSNSLPPLPEQAAQPMNIEEIDAALQEHKRIDLGNIDPARGVFILGVVAAERHHAIAAAPPDKGLTMTDEQITELWKTHSDTLSGWDYGGTEVMYEGRFEEAARAIEAEATAPLLAHIAALTGAIDQEMCISHLGVFNEGDDPTAAIKKLMQWSQGVGEYFEGDRCKERIAELEAKLAYANEVIDQLTTRLAGKQPPTDT